MRLLHTLKYTLHEFHGDGIPEYVILSHTWGQGEVTFQDIQDVDKASAKPGFQKIAGTCRKAASDGFEYCWIDTCCIDKSSSAELSEAINSMYSWYKGSRICYAYLSDISRTGTQDADFGKSRWWRRGWTLQELIAPAVVEFYDVNWEELGSKSSIQEAISSLTGIGVQVLLGDNPAECTVAERMSWASKRSTTRIEDRAYSLMGLFNVHLPMLYGEGHKAFARLQEEIMKTTEDYTILAW
ncbi:HET-domain-containing protein, partial [Eremomyces bilateralis CBS 781.70]